MSRRYIIAAALLLGAVSQAFAQGAPTPASVCALLSAQVMVFVDPGAEASWEGMLKRFGQEKNQRTPVAGLGSSAYVIYPPPRNEYQATVAMLVVRSGRNLLVVSTAAARGKPADSALAPTLALARLVLPRLK